MRIQALATHLDMKNRQLVEVLSSTAGKCRGRCGWWAHRARTEDAGGYAGRYPVSGLLAESIRQLAEGTAQGRDRGLKRTLLEMQCGKAASTPGTAIAART